MPGSVTRSGRLTPRRSSSAGSSASAPKSNWIRVRYWISAMKLLPAMSAQRLEDADEIRHRGAAHIEDAGELGVLDLDAAGRAGELHRGEHMHRNAGGADRMPLGFEATRGIDRQLAVLLGPALEN